MPGGVPKYVRCYQAREEVYDPFTIVFSRANRAGFNPGWVQYITVSEGGSVMHGEHERQIDWPSYAHLGRRRRFEELPEPVRQAVVRDYVEMWQLPPLLTMYPFAVAAVLPYGAVPAILADRS